MAKIMSPQDPENRPFSPPDQAGITLQLSDIQKKYTKQLPEKLALIEQLWNKLRYFNWSTKALNVLFSLVHTLAGNGKTFGFQQVSIACKKIEAQLRVYVNSDHIPDTEKQNEISTLIEALIKAVAKNGRSTGDQHKQSTQIKAQTRLKRHQHNIYIVDDDEHLTDFLATQLKSAGYNVETFYAIADVLNRIKDCAPSALIMDIMFPGETDMQGILASEQIQGITGSNIPTIYISSRSDITARLGVLRAKGNAFFSKPVLPEKLIAKIDDVIITKKNTARIAIIDDDNLVAERNAIILSKYDYQTLVINEPLLSLEKIKKFKPDLILMDIHMPDINGLELAQIIKQDDAHISTPILFLSADKREAIKQAAMTISGDEFLTKDITQNELLRKIHSRLTNASIVKSQIKEISKQNNIDGLVNRKYFFSILEKSIAEIEAPNSLFLIHISVDHYELISKQINLLNLDDFIGHIATTLMACLNVHDIICKITDQCIAILCHKNLQTVNDISADFVKASARNPFIKDNIRTEFTVSVGIAEINQASTNSEQVFTQVEQAVTQAQSQGGNQIHLYSLTHNDDSSCSITSPETVERIYNAIDQRRFKLVFQPIIGMGDNNDEHYEVLLRLVDKNNKLYLPAQFFPIIKQNNLTQDVDRWVIEKTLNIYANKTNIKTRGNFFVKLSGESLSQNAFSTWLCNSIASAGLQGNSRITFEIPEAEIITRNKEIHKFIAQMPHPTCQFAIDHFGTTEYSTQFLTDFNFDYVKLSGALVNKILTDNKTSLKVQALIKQAHDANIDVIAEALEDPKTLTLLWAWGVRYFQGYFIHSPAEDFDYDFSSHGHSL